MPDRDSDGLVEWQVDIEDYRIKEIFEARKEAKFALSRVNMSSPKKFETQAQGLQIAHGAVKSYIIVSQDVITDDTEEARWIWHHVPLGEVEIPRGKEEPKVRTYEGLESILEAEAVWTERWEERNDRDSFMAGNGPRTREKQYHMPIDVLWKGYQLTTQMLSERGFEIDEKKPPGHIGHNGT